MTEKTAPETIPELDALRSLVEQRSGITFDAAPGSQFVARVHEHVRQNNFRDIPALLLNVRDNEAQYNLLLEFLLEEDSQFFRHPAVFDEFSKRILPELQEKKFWDAPRTLRIWSAGCSTGEEAYSIAMAVEDDLPFAETWRIEILATDISRRALQRAERGVYSGRSLQKLTANQLENYFTKTRHGSVVKPRIRRAVTFAPFNLTDVTNIRGMDCIFCIDVLGYLSGQRRNEVLHAFSKCLEPGGYLVLDSTESFDCSAFSLENVSHGACRTYQKHAKESDVRQAVVAEGGL
jgi:chemotaxis methyl-accepting protein methylase